MSFAYHRTIRLSDTDAAGVVYFANVMQICHEAYEESLANAKINLNQFLNNSSIALPIVHASVDFFRPLVCGDRIVISLETKQLSDNEFAIDYSIVREDDLNRVVATAKTRHVCINTGDRKRINLPDPLDRWLNSITD
jgi:1,4-dihydroxy-2-naphthoyl-CoA hydrolase